MPLNLKALPLEPDPESVKEARAWVREVLERLDREEIVETAELGVSELVTNAILHGSPPITVRVRGTRDHPRVEVHDASRQPPILPGSEPLSDAGDDDLLLTFGRGLDIVARCSTAWGAQIEEDGKIVWFVPSTESHDDTPVPGVISGADGGADRWDSGDLIEVEIRDASLPALSICQNHCRELYREVRLLSLAHESRYPLAKSLAALFGSLDQLVRDGIDADEVEGALARGKRTATLTVTVPRRTVASIDRFLELLDLADAFCREERLLSLARSREQRRFQEWFFGEFVRQQQGESPIAWSEAAQGRQSVS